jgi:hypothetical protein
MGVMLAMFALSSPASDLSTQAEISCCGVFSGISSSSIGYDTVPLEESGMIEFMRVTLYHFLMSAPSIPHCSAGLPGPCWWSEQANPDDTEASTAQTVRAMCREIHAGAYDPLVLSMVPAGASWPAAVWSAFWVAKHRVKFVQDEITLARLLNKHGELDFLQSPPVLLRMRRPEGDCDCFTMLICALLEASGVEWRICTVKCDAREPWRWSHVYSCAVNGDQRIPLDASHGAAPGWEVPARDVFEYAEWDSAGRRLPAKLAPRPMGQYMPQWGLGRRGMGARRRGFRGLGDDTTGDGGGDPGTGAPLDLGASLNSQFGVTVPTTAPQGTYGSSSSSSGPNVALDNTLAALASQWTKIAGQTIAPQVTIQGPGGQLITGPSSSFAQLTGSLLPSSLSSSSMSSILMLGALAVVGFVVIKAVSK